MQEYVLLRLGRESLVYYEVGFVPQAAISTLAEEPIIFDDN